MKIVGLSSGWMHFQPYVYVLTECPLPLVSGKGSIHEEVEGFDDRVGFPPNTLR